MHHSALMHHSITRLALHCTAVLALVSSSTAILSVEPSLFFLSCTTFFSIIAALTAGERGVMKLVPATRSARFCDENTSRCLPGSPADTPVMTTGEPLWRTGGALAVVSDALSMALSVSSCVMGASAGDLSESGVVGTVRLRPEEEGRSACMAAGPDSSCCAPSGTEGKKDRWPAPAPDAESGGGTCVAGEGSVATAVLLLPPPVVGPPAPPVPPAVSSGPSSSSISRTWGESTVWPSRGVRIFSTMITWGGY